MTRDERGITLVELLVVLAISALIVGILATVIYQIFDITGWGNRELVVQHDLQNAATWLNRDVLSASEAEVIGYRMVLTIPTFITDPINITYTYSETTGTLTRDSIIIARHVYSDPFPSLPEPIEAPNVVTVTLYSKEGDVPGSGTFALKMRAGGTMEVAWAPTATPVGGGGGGGDGGGEGEATPTPTPGCQIFGAANLKFAGKKVQWDIWNDGSDTAIEEIYVAWPSGNYELNEIQFGKGNNIIWTGLKPSPWEEPPSTTISPSLGVLTISTSDGTKTLQFRFESDAVGDNGLYSINITFTNGCGVSFNYP